LYHNAPRFLFRFVNGSVAQVSISVYVSFACHVLTWTRYCLTVWMRAIASALVAEFSLNMPLTTEV
jgi:hypothetical protein